MDGMTAYGRAKTTFQWGEVCWELRSVNHRYLDVVFRSESEMGALETPLREKLAKHVLRGRVDVLLTVSVDSAKQATLVVDSDLAQQLVDAADFLSTKTQLSKQDFRLKDVLFWPGVLKQQQFDISESYADILSVFDLALDDFKAHRQREGEKLKLCIEDRLKQMTDQLSRVKQDEQTFIKDQFDRLQTQLTDLLGNHSAIDPDRLNHEIAILLQKADIDEEIDRIFLHIDEVRHSITQSGAVGRRLDFLMQELNREANTLASKALTTQLRHMAVELKVLIEQMREQVQNVV